jgi:hypothetical protein
MSFVITAIVGASAAAAVGTASAIDAGVKSRKAKNAANQANRDLDQLEKNRQAIVNPYANISNEFAGMGVATQAAQMQAEEADVALANTLDTLMATGSGAGGATALAQAALKSKQGVSANIEQQEASNQKLRAQGAMDVQKLKASGEQWKWEQQEERELQKLDRTQYEVDQARAQQVASQEQMWSAIGDIGSAGMNLASFGISNADE